MKTSMRKPIAILLCLSIAFSPLAGALGAEDVDSNDMQSRTAKRAFLLDLRERVKMYMDQNLVYLSGLKLCLEHKPTLMNCDKELGSVRKNIKIQYPKMRKLFLLMNMLQPYFHAKLIQVYENQLDALIGGTGTSAALVVQDYIRASPIEGLWTGVIEGLWKNDSLPNVPFSDEEILDALDGETVAIEGTKYFENLRSYESWYCELAFGEGASGCRDLKLEYLPGKKSLRYAKLPVDHVWRNADGLRLITDLADKTAAQQMAASKRMKQKFYDIVQLNPYIALVSSASPSDAELLNAITLMQGKANENLVEYELRLQKLNRIDVSDAELMRLLDYGPVAMDLLKEPGENMLNSAFDYQSLYEEVSEQHMYDELWRSGGYMALMLGANALICWSAGRGIKFLSTSRKVIKLREWHKFFNPLCFSLSQIPINGWFVYDSFKYYHQTYKEVFSTADGTHFIREVNALSSAQRGIFWSLAMSTLGTGYGVKYLAGEARLPLSKAFRAYLSRIK